MARRQLPKFHRCFLRAPAQGCFVGAIGFALLVEYVNIEVRCFRTKAVKISNGGLCPLYLQVADFCFWNFLHLTKGVYKLLRCCAWLRKKIMI